MNWFDWFEDFDVSGHYIPCFVELQIQPDVNKLSLKFKLRWMLSCRALLFKNKISQKLWATAVLCCSKPRPYYVGDKIINIGLYVVFISFTWLGRVAFTPSHLSLNWCEAHKTVGRYWWKSWAWRIISKPDFSSEIKSMLLYVYVTGLGDGCTPLSDYNVFETHIFWLWLFRQMHTYGYTLIRYLCVL